MRTEFIADDGQQFSANVNTIIAFFNINIQIDDESSPVNIAELSGALTLLKRANGKMKTLAQQEHNNEDVIIAIDTLNGIIKRLIKLLERHRPRDDGSPD